TLVRKIRRLTVDRNGTYITATGTVLRKSGLWKARFRVNLNGQVNFEAVGERCLDKSTPPPMFAVERGAFVRLRDSRRIATPSQHRPIDDWPMEPILRPQNKEWKPIDQTAPEFRQVLDAFGREQSKL